MWENQSDPVFTTFIFIPIWYSTVGSIGWRNHLSNNPNSFWVEVYTLVQFWKTPADRMDPLRSSRATCPVDFHNDLIRWMMDSFVRGKIGRRLNSKVYTPTRRYAHAKMTKSSWTDRRADLLTSKVTKIVPRASLEIVPMFDTFSQL